MLFPYSRSCALKRDQTASKGETYEEPHIIFLARACRRQPHRCPERHPVVFASAHGPASSNVSAGVPRYQVEKDASKSRQATVVSAGICRIMTPVIPREV